MTKEEAKELLIKQWTWHRDNPTKTKIHSPYWDFIKDMPNHCILCEYYLKSVACCDEACPLVRQKATLFGEDINCYSKLSDFRLWQNCVGRLNLRSIQIKQAQKACQNIIDRIKKWKV